MVTGKWTLPRTIWTNRLLLLGLSLLSISLLTSSATKGRAFSLEVGSIEKYFAFMDSTRFEEGDILLRQGNSFISSMIVKAFPTAQGMSHCGILVRDRGSWRIIHSISGSISDTDGIRIDNLTSFMSKAHPGHVRHVKPTFQIDRKLLRHGAWHYLKQNAPFDHDFDLETRNRLYCSELIRAVYLDAGAEDVFVYKTIGGKKLVDLGSFFESQYWH